MDTDEHEALPVLLLRSKLSLSKIVGDRQGGTQHLSEYTTWMDGTGERPRVETVFLGGTWGFHAPIWGTHPTDKTPSSPRFSPTSLTLTALTLTVTLTLSPRSPHQSLPRFSNLSSRFTYGTSSALVTQGPTPMSPALPCHLDPLHPSIFGLVLCAPGLHCTSTRAQKHIRRDGILCLSSAAAQDWGITLRLRTLLASSAPSAASPKAKASPPRGPDLDEEISDHQGEQESPEAAGRGTREEPPMEHEETSNCGFSARQNDGVKLSTMTSNDQHERARRPKKH
ncbi:hypothetical protein CSAL01_08877 [Colletotrichum salicis]|uniref:Uncharacterized protein n=1 Tax=Colletotrichum salicis TaxID=1209931 RepID=A0A135ULG0_9PEZI|nr:hypothetical protein CSAL01_08877 [Colletotrichum salicis]